MDLLFQQIKLTFETHVCSFHFSILHLIFFAASQWLIIHSTKGHLLLILI